MGAHRSARPAEEVWGSAVAFFFFLFIHYSHATYQIMARLYTVRFPVRCPRSGVVGAVAGNR